MNELGSQSEQQENEPLMVFEQMLARMKSIDEWRTLLLEMRKPLFAQNDELTRDDEAIRLAKIAFGHASQVIVEQALNSQNAMAQIVRNYAMAEVALEEAKLAFYDVRDQAYQEGSEFDGITNKIRGMITRLLPPKPSTTE